MFTAKTFDAIFDSEPFFIDSSPKIVKNWVSLTCVDSSKNLLSGFTNNESELGLVMPTRLTEKQLRAFQGTFGCR